MKFPLTIFTKPDIEQLIKNGQTHETGKDHVPVVKLFLRSTGRSWLLTKINPENPLIAYGLYDSGNGNPTLGDINIAEVLSLKNDQGDNVERDSYYFSKYPISQHAKAAKHFGYIVDEAFLAIINRKPPDYSP